MKSYHVGACIACCAGLCMAGVPTIQQESVVMLQNSRSRQVTISYTLEEEPGIVTVDIRTNGVSIGAKNFTPLAGDVNRIIDVGDHTILWRPDKTWPGHIFTNGCVSAVVTAWSTNTPPNYMVLDLDLPSGTWYYTCEDALPGGISNIIYRTDKLVMRKIPAANVTWRMSSPSGEVCRNTENERARYVMLSDDYYMGVFPITRGQHKKLRGGIPSGIIDDPVLPIQCINYKTIRGSLEWPENSNIETGSVLDSFRKFTGKMFDLPTEAQWEFACRAGCAAAFYSGEEVTVYKTRDSSLVEPVAEALGWYDANSAVDGTRCVHPVGLKQPNNWGLYDMCGNVWEWCLDRYENLPDVGTVVQVDPVGPQTGGPRLLRGGSFQHAAYRMRSSERTRNDPTTDDPDNIKYYGYRFVCPVR